MFFVLLRRLARGVRAGLEDPEFRALLGIVGILLGGGTWFYTVTENWRVLDSLYFSVITLTTVGYGDFSPETAAGKVFTMIYVLLGLGVLLAFVERLAREAWASRRGKSDQDGSGAAPSP